MILIELLQVVGDGLLLTQVLIDDFDDNLN